MLSAEERSRCSPVAQAFALARTELGDVEILEIGAAMSKDDKPKGNFVCPELSRNAFLDMLYIEEKFGVQAVWTLDGSWRHVDKVGMTEARAAVRHDGLVLGGRLERELDGTELNAYMGELAAQVD